jgi:hypothetical protein
MASGPPWLVSGFRLRARLGFSIPSTFSGPRGITPAFGYGAPHSSARGTSTLLNNALLSAHYTAVRLPGAVREGLVLMGSPSGPPLSQGCGQHRDLLVAVHRVSMHAWGLRPRGADPESRAHDPVRVAFRSGLTASALRNAFFEAQYPACMCPCQRFDPDLTACVA